MIHYEYQVYFIFVKMYIGYNKNASEDIKDHSRNINNNEAAIWTILMFRD